ncbi:leucine-rich repeat-containing protein 43-like isoform X2 [Littorina saxatilis]|uniref:leucine-rich repeat-containing protein 43-like isoform X2 n=1 Tax=Littorina saxatilis TaxID=31220 RepID=UPI0038B46F73
MAAVVSDQYVPAFNAFQSQLNTLCIKEFPCGLGPWREPDANFQKPRKIRLKSITGRIHRPPVDLNLSREPDAQSERTEALQELVASKFSPWHLDYSWSDEARELREIAVKSPWLIDTQFVLNHFRTLKIVDKGVTEVDARLLQLENLTELTLTANFIRRVNSKHLPKSLQVLELYANEISDISGLCVRPPLLLHLGLGYNSICFIDDYITGDYWPALLSLDLSNNNLTDLLDIVRKVYTLPKLRNLILLGNPLSLIPGYRGYTIDSLQKLSVLDDIRISADDRHHFKGLAHRREYILDEAKVALEVTYLKGVPLPEEVKFPDEQPEYPIIERNYYVQFMFPADLSAHASHLHNMTHDDFDLVTVTDAEHHDGISDMSARLEAGSAQSGSQPEKNVFFNQHPETKVLEGLTLPLIEETEEPPRTARAVGTQGGQGGVFKDKSETPVETKPKIPLSPITSVAKPWAEDIELEWKAEVTRFDLTVLRDFFKQGMDFSIVEKMVLCYPKEEEENVETPTGSKKGKDGGKDKTDAKGKKGAEPAKKDKKDAGKNAGKNAGKDTKKGKDDKGKKKKKGEEQELRREAPQLTTLAMFHIPLAEFLEGEFDYTNVFTKGGVEITPSTARSITSADQKKTKAGKGKKGETPDKKDKDKEKDKKKDPPPRGKGKDDKKGGKDDKKGKKGAHAQAPEDGDETPPPPPPLEVQVAVRLHHWTTALDSLKEEERNRNGIEQ